LILSVAGHQNPLPSLLCASFSALNRGEQLLCTAVFLPWQAGATQCIGGRAGQGRG
jgi:hypothetical protein